MSKQIICFIYFIESVSIQFNQMPYTIESFPFFCFCNKF